MERKIKKLQDKQKKIQKDLKKAKEIAYREPIEKTSFKDLYEEYDIPPYALTLLSYYHFGEENFNELTEEPSNGRVRSKFEKGIEKALVGLCCGVMVAVITPMAAILETPIALPVLAVTAGQSAVYTNYNKNIKKAQKRVTELEEQSKKIQEEISKLKQSEAGMEL